eukprot:Em0001g112a
MLTAKATSGIPRSANCGLTTTRTLASGSDNNSLIGSAYAKFLEKFPDAREEKVPKPYPASTNTRRRPFFTGGGGGGSKKAFLNQTDSLGLVGVVFGPAGTGKSNVVRTVCRSNKGVIYMEIGSPRQFPYHLAKACGVPVEPNWWDAVVSRLFGTFQTYVTLPSSDQDALALVLPIIAEGAKAYKTKSKYIPVLFIDGVDILAKQKNNRLYVNLVDWAKKCANEDSLRIVLVCSDSHVLALDQQSFKSRLDALIEIDDATETKAVNELMIEKYNFPTTLAKSTYDIVGGRLADIHKMVSIWKRGTVIPQEVVEATKDINNDDELREEIHKALNGTIANPNEDKSKEIKMKRKR